MRESEVGFSHSLKKAEMLLGFQSYEPGVEEPGESLCKVNAKKLGALH